MGALVAVGGIAAERQQGRANVVAGGNRRMGVAVVVAKQVAAHRQFMARGQAQQVPRQVIVVWAAGVLHGDTHRMLAGVLAWRDRGDVDADKLTHVPGQCAGRPGTGFLGDGEQRVAVD
ncbi:hypothetical protein D3C84_431210 [compost metagenome]